MNSLRTRKQGARKQFKESLDYLNIILKHIDVAYYLEIEVR